MATKFSDFTAQAATGTTFVVGYDGTTNTQYSQNNLTNFVLDGTLSANRLLNFNSNTLQLGNQGTDGGGVKIFQDGRIEIARQSGSFKVTSYGTQLRQNFLRLYSNTTLGATVTGFATLAASSNWTDGGTGGNGFNISARLGVIGVHNDNTSYAFRVQNSDNDELMQVRNDGVIAIGKGATLPNNSTSTVIGTSASANGNGTAIGNYARALGGGATVLGSYSTAAGSFSVAIGYDTDVAAVTSSIGIGANANVGAANSINIDASGNSSSSNNDAGTLKVHLTSHTTPSFQVDAANGMTPPTFSSNPSSPSAGNVIYNTSDNKLKFYNGTDWTDAGGGGGSIYTADGSIDENRIVTIANNGNVPYSVNFKGNSGAAGAGPVFLQIENERLDGAYSTNSGAQLRLKGGSSSGSLNTDLDIIAHGSNFGGSSAPQVHFNSNRGYTFTAGTGGSSTNNGVSQDLVLSAGSAGAIIASATTNFGNNTNTTIAMIGGGGNSSSMIQMGKSGNNIGKFFRGSANGVLQIGKHSGGAYGSAGTTTTEIYVDGSSNVGIGDNTTIDAKLHVKGAGLTNGTTAFLVEDSSGNDIMKALDDRSIGLGYNATQITTDSTSGGNVWLRNTTGSPLFSVGVVSGATGKINVYGGFYNTFEYGSGRGLVFTNEAGFNVSQDLSSMLTCVSVTKGFLPPRMTTTQRDAINSGTFTTGLTLYNTTDNKLQFYNGSAWTDATGGGDNIYTADGNILATRTINDRAGGFTGTAGSNALKMNVRNSGALMVAGYQNNGDPGTTNNCIRWGPGTTAGGMNVKGNLGLASGGGSISLINSGGSQFFGIGQGGTTINTSVGIGLTSGVSSQLHVKGSGATFATTSLLVENSNNDDLIKVLDSGRISIGLNAVNSNDGNVVFGNSASASGTTNNSVVIGQNSNITGSVNGVAVGGATLASGSNSSIAIGPAYINGVEAIAIGNSSRSNIGAVSIGHDSGSENNLGSYNLCLGTRAKNTNNASNVIVLNATGSTTATSGTIDDTFSVFMSNASVPDFKIAHDGNSYITGTGNFGFGDGNTSPTATVDIDGTFRLRSATNVSGKVLTADANGNGTWQTAGGGSAGQNLLAITSITGSGGSQVSHDIKVYSSTTSNNFAAINFNSDETERYAKIVFTPTGTVAKVVFRALGEDVGGTGEAWLGLHSSSSQTASPAYGWFLINKDAESGEYEHITAEWLLTGLTANQQITAYVMGISSSPGSTFYARELNTGAWNSTSDTTAFPVTVEAYDVSATVTSNPSS